MQLAAGTGAAPSNGDATSGLRGNPVGYKYIFANGGYMPFAVTDTLSGLTPGVALWADVALNSSLAVGTATIANVHCTATVFP